jgi:hypothetical protein
MKYTNEMASDSVILILRFMTITGIQVILGLLPEEFKRRQCWYYWWEGFMKYTNVIHIPSFVMISSGIQVI